MRPCCGGSASPGRSQRPCCFSLPIRPAISPAKRWGFPAAWGWADDTCRRRYRGNPGRSGGRTYPPVYRSWNRDTSVAQMRRDWDAAFGGCALPVSCSPINDGGIDGEWIAPADAPPDKAILYFHGGGFRVGSVSSHRGLIAQIADASGCRVLAINYRLAPEHRFPAALDDVLAAYGWMREQGLQPSNV